MYVTESGLTVSATDLVGFLCCPHLTSLSFAAALGQLEAPQSEDPELALLARHGLHHESAYLEHLRSGGLEVAEIEVAEDGDLPRAVAETNDAIRSGVDVIYQATFLHDEGAVSWRAHADFLRRVPSANSPEGYSYEPEDTKLAGHVRAGAVIQLCHYAEQLGRIQGQLPDRVHVVLRGMQRVTIELASVSAYYRVAKARFLEALENRAGTYPVPVEHCAMCSWQHHCEERWELDDSLCRVAGLRVSQARKLSKARITTLAALARTPEDTVPGIRSATLARLRSQAKLQERARHQGALPYQLVEPVEQGRGLCALPEPSEGDLFFDIEADPFVGSEGLEYLLGAGWVEEGRFFYRSWWAHTFAEEKIAFEQFIDFVSERLERHPDMHVYHYASYERAALERLLGRHATREEAVDALFRGEVLVDLYRVVQQGLMVGSSSYSLKKLEPLYMADREDEISDASSSIVAYEQWLEDRDARRLEAIERYNRTDCDSTRRLRGWLEERRAELGAALGIALPRPDPADPRPSESVSEDASEVAGLAAALTRGAGEPPDHGADPEEAARWLLAQLLGWHRREDKREWWKYFDRVLHQGDDELFDDPEAIAGLEHVGTDGAVRRSTVHVYRFDPAQ